MAKDYVTIKLSYEAVTTEIDVLTSRETYIRNEIFTIQRALSGSHYKQVTGSVNTWTYGFSKVNTDLFDFFNDAYESGDSGNTITFERENDDATFTSFTVIVNKPVYSDDTITTEAGQKIYNNFSCEILES